MKEPQDRKKSMTEILASVTPVEKSVTICLAGNLQAEFERLERELAAAMKSQHMTLAGNPEVNRLSAEIEAVQEQMAAHEVTFTFRAVSAKRFSDLLAEHPPRQGKDERFNLSTFPDALLAACALEPAMSLDEVTQLGDSLSAVAYSELFDCAWMCNQKSLDVPFSQLVSRVRRASETS